MALEGGDERDDAQQWGVVLGALRRELVAHVAGGAHDDCALGPADSTSSGVTG